MVLWNQLCLSTTLRDDSCPKGCRCKRNRIDCSNNIFRNLTFTMFPKSITYLNLHSTNLTCIPEEIFKFSKLRRLNFENNSIEDITSKQFSFLGSVVNVNLRKNALVQLPRTASSQTKKSRLKTLDLSENKLEALEARSFILFPSMVNLNLSFNRLISIDKDAFIGLKNLRNLYLNNNLLDSIRSLTFRPLGLLTNLDMSNSLISLFGDGAFLNARNLRNLNLTHNRISQIGGWLFGLSSLTAIDLSFNNIKSLEENDTSMWSLVSSLQWISLSHNRISYISKAFGVMKHLQYLYLNDNNIRNIVDGAFLGINNLIHLDLSGNFLDEYFENDEAFKGSNLKLKELVIGFNGISRIPANMLGYVFGLDFLDASRNPISVIQENAFQNLKLEQLILNTSSMICDCNSLWLYNWFKLSNISRAMVNIKCNYPKKVNGTDFFDLQISLLSCDNINDKDLFPQPQILNHSNVLTKSLMGETLKVSCIITGAAPFDVEWSLYSNGRRTLPSQTVQNRYGEIEQAKNDVAKVYIHSDLIFSNISIKDEGMYRCSARNPYGVVYSPKIRIIVGEEPFMTIFPKNLAVSVGSVAVLQCAAKGTPSPVIKWQKEGGWIQAAEDKRLYIKTEEPLLYIMKTKKSDEGIYKCIAENSFGSIQASARLFVYGSFITTFPRSFIFYRILLQN